MTDRRSPFMTNFRLSALRMLGIVHIVVGILGLALTTFFGLLVTPIFGPGAVWMIVLGCRLWNPTERVLAHVRATHRVLLVIAGLSLWYGYVTYQAAERSAAMGGGLLGGFWILPAGFGIVMAVVSLISLLLARQRSAGPP
jgi:hypothetical protein